MRSLLLPMLKKRRKVDARRKEAKVIATMGFTPVEQLQPGPIGRVFYV